MRERELLRNLLGRNDRLEVSTTTTAGLSNTNNTLISTAALSSSSFTMPVSCLPASSKIVCLHVAKEFGYRLAS